MRRGAVYWKAKLEDALGAEYTVSCPIVPASKQSRYAEWRERIEDSVSRMEDGLILLGHSLGGSVVLKCLSEGRLQRTVAGLFILAAPYWSKDSGWQSNEFRLSDGFAERLQISRIFLYHSRDDEEVPFAHLSYYAKRLRHAVVRALDGQGHEFRDRDTPELIRDLRSVGTVVLPRTRSKR